MLTEPFIGKSPIISNNARSLWQPLVGLVWDPSGVGKWAVRAGFGIHNDLQDKPTRLRAETAARFSSRCGSSSNAIWPQKGTRNL